MVDRIGLIGRQKALGLELRRLSSRAGEVIE